MPKIITLPPITDPRWHDLATGKISQPWQMLALKIMLAHVVNATKADPSPANIQKNATEIRAFFEKNIKMAKKDLATIFGEQLKGG